MSATKTTVDRLSMSSSRWDRLCLAAARVHDVPVLTSDRARKDIADEVGVSVELIR